MNMNEPTDSNKVWRGLNTVLTILLISTPLFLVQIFGASASSVDSLPVSIRATSQADYSSDSQTFLIPPISENILNQLITNIPATSSGEDRLATLQAELSSPVPTMTGNVLPVTPTASLLPQTVTGTVVAATTPTAITPMATVTPRATSTPITVSTATPGLPTPLPTLVTIPSSVPTNLPLPTTPPVLPTLPPILPTGLPLVPTITSLLPTLIPPLFP